VSASVNETEPLVDIESRKIVREDVLIIESSLKYANDLLHSMLDLNRGNTEITVRTIPTDLKKDVLDPVASMIHRQKNDASFEVFTECLPDSLIVSIDRLRLKQIVLNLVRNASRFVESGGFIRLKAKILEQGAAPDGENMCKICISVEDSGPGVPLETQDSLFNKCQESHGGDKEYRSGVPGKTGAKFDVCLQCRLIKAENERMPNGVASTASGGSSESSHDTIPPHTDEELPEHLSVLFVDDDNVLRKLFVRSVRRICPNWTIKEANSGERALEICNEEGNASFHIIFLDQYMSSVDRSLLGTDTARSMRKQGVSSIICGLSANDMQEAFRSAGADFFMLKPFPCEPNLLRESLAGILSGPRNSRRYSTASTIDE
jgi:CheY-like chemotaxis protein